MCADLQAIARPGDKHQARISNRAETDPNADDARISSNRGPTPMSSGG